MGKALKRLVRKRERKGETANSILKHGITSQIEIEENDNGIKCVILQPTDYSYK